MTGKSMRRLYAERDKAWLVLFILLGTLLRLYQLDAQSLWADEGLQYFIASADRIGGVLERAQYRTFHPPLAFLSESPPGSQWSAAVATAATRDQDVLSRRAVTEAQNHLASLISQHDRIWIVYSHSNMYGNILKDILKNSYALKENKKYYSLSHVRHKKYIGIELLLFESSKKDLPHGTTTKHTILPSLNPTCTINCYGS